MKKLRPYPHEAKPFYTDAVSRKDDGADKFRLQQSQPQVHANYDIYDAHFAAGTIAQLQPDAALTPNRLALQSLYTYKATIIQEFKRVVEQQQQRAFRHTCQYCTLASSSSFDHYVPQGAFPEFAVHVLNLVPCCTVCNSKKSHLWRNGNNRLFLNFYIDELPDEQFLFVDIFLDATGEIDFRFRVENPNGIEYSLFTLISSHFKKLELCDRMRIAACSAFIDLRTSMATSMQHSHLVDIVDAVILTAERNRFFFGNNYWKSALEIALAQNPLFITEVQNEFNASQVI